MTIGERIDSWIASLSFKWRWLWMSRAERIRALDAKAGNTLLKPSRILAEMEADLARKAMFAETLNRTCVSREYDASYPSQAKIGDTVNIRVPPRYRWNESTSFTVKPIDPNTLSLDDAKAIAAMEKAVLGSGADGFTTD